jgi:hypothetical protein
MRKITLFVTMLICTTFLSAQLIKNTTVSEVLASEDFEKDSVWITFDQAGLDLNLHNSFGGSQSYKWSNAWGGAAFNSSESASGGTKCMQIHWGGYAILEGLVLDLNKIYQIEVMVHPAGGNDGTWNNCSCVHLFTFDNSQLWQTQGLRIRLANGGAGGNPNTLYADMWLGEDGAYSNAMIFDYNTNPGDYYVNGTEAAYWLPLKVIFTGLGTTTNPFLIDYYLNNKFVGSQSLNSLYWLGDQMVGFGRYGGDNDHGKFDNLKISTLTQTTGINPVEAENTYYFNSSDYSINLKGNSLNSPIHYDLFNMVGVNVYSGSFEGTKAIIPQSKISKGLYIAKINDGKDANSILRFLVK